MLNIILYGVEKPENLGSIARITKNFGFNNLILVKPKCTPRDEKAIIVSKHARDLLEKTRVYKRIPRKIDLLIGANLIFAFLWIRADILILLPNTCKF